jgi:hypothetical protein
MAAAAPQQGITLVEANPTVLHLLDPNNQQHYQNGKKSLEGDTYEGDTRGLLVFLAACKAKVIMYHWFNVLALPNANNLQHNIWLQYGQRSI